MSNNDSDDDVLKQVMEFEQEDDTALGVRLLEEEEDTAERVRELEQEDDTAVGYIHNISSYKTGNYFDCQLQTETKTIQAVCFSPKKRKAICDYSTSHTLVKFQKFKLETKYDSEDIILYK